MNKNSYWSLIEAAEWIAMVLAREPDAALKDVLWPALEAGQLDLYGSVDGSPIRQLNSFELIEYQPQNWRTRSQSAPQNRILILSKRHYPASVVNDRRWCTGASYPSMAPQYCREIASASVFSADVIKFWPTVTIDKGGRPLKYNWPEVEVKLREYVKKNGLMKSVTELQQKCADYASELHPKGETPDDATVRAAIQRYGFKAICGL